MNSFTDVVECAAWCKLYARDDVQQQQKITKTIIILFFYNEFPLQTNEQLNDAFTCFSVCWYIQAFDDKTLVDCNAVRVFQQCSRTQTVNAEWRLKKMVYRNLEKIKKIMKINSGSVFYVEF